MYQNEKEVAKKAEQMLEAALRSKTSSFKDHVNRKTKEPSLKQAIASAKVKDYGDKSYMRSLSIKMGKHGFIQNYGVDIVRKGGRRKRETPQITVYGFKAHTMKMEAKPFIKEAVEQSGVVDFVMENITKIRSEEILVHMKSILEK